MHSWTSSKHDGFSLLELLVVLVLVALVTATVVVRWSGVQHEATLDAAVRELQFVDAHLRRYARTHGKPCNLAFDLKTHQLQKQYHSQAQKNPAWQPLGRNIEIKQFDSTSKVPKKNRIELTIHPDGTSATYGLALQGSANQNLWLIVAGISGEFTPFTNRKEYAAAWNSLSPQM